MVRRPSRAFVTSVAALLFLTGPAFSQSDEACLACHGNRDFTGQQGKSLFVSADAFLASVHGKADISCVSCHVELKGVGDFPHPAKLRPARCDECHEAAVQKASQSIHARAKDPWGNTRPVGCAACHGSHDIQPAGSPRSPVSRSRIVLTCGTCHVGIERDYLEGVHGKDYVKGIKDVPVCTDCHGGHDILSPQDSDSRVYATRVATVCSRCHDDVVLSRQYGLLTSRLKTYSRTFHGTASKYGETRVANCASCHGYHDIRASDDPRSSIHPANLPRTCGRCHPGASHHFAEGKIHFRPEEAVPARYRSSHVVKIVYLIVIAVIIGAMLLFISADLLRRLVHRKRRG